MTAATMPGVCRPPEVEQAASVLAQRQRDLADVEAEAREARAGIAAAEVEDRQAYAAARDQGKRDPGPKHVAAARERLADVERRLGGERLRLSVAEDAVQAALREYRDEWATALEAAQVELDAASLTAIERLERAEHERSQVRATRAWLATGKARAGVVQSGLKRNMNGDLFSVPELVDGLKQAIGDSTLSAEQERAAERERAERVVAEREEALRHGSPA